MISLFSSRIIRSPTEHSPSCISDIQIHVILWESDGIRISALWQILNSIQFLGVALVPYRKNTCEKPVKMIVTSLPKFWKAKVSFWNLTERNLSRNQSLRTGFPSLYSYIPTDISKLPAPKSYWHQKARHNYLTQVISAGCLLSGLPNEVNMVSLARTMRVLTHFSLPPVPGCPLLSPGVLLWKRTPQMRTTPSEEPDTSTLLLSDSFIVVCVHTWAVLLAN